MPEHCSRTGQSEPWPLTPRERWLADDTRLVIIGAVSTVVVGLLVLCALVILR